jgi:hypothetical protein
MVSALLFVCPGAPPSASSRASTRIIKIKQPRPPHPSPFRAILSLTQDAGKYISGSSTYPVVVVVVVVVVVIVVVVVVTASLPAPELAREVEEALQGHGVAHEEVGHEGQHLGPPAVAVPATHTQQQRTRSRAIARIRALRRLHPSKVAGE